MSFKGQKKKGTKDQPGLTGRVERLETWFVTALLGLITVLAHALVAVLLR